MFGKYRRSRSFILSVNILHQSKIRYYSIVLYVLPMNQIIGETPESPQNFEVMGKSEITIMLQSHTCRKKNVFFFCVVPVLNMASATFFPSVWRGCPSWELKITIDFVVVEYLFFANWGNLFFRSSVIMLHYCDKRW